MKFDRSKFIDYVTLNYPHSEILPLIKSCNFIDSDGKYLVSFRYQYLAEKAKESQGKFNNLFKLVLELKDDVEVEIYYDKDGIYLDEQEKEEEREAIVKREAEEKEQKESDHQSHINGLLNYSHIPYNKRELFTFDKYHISKGNIKAVEVIKNHQSIFLTICGSTGIGKTHLAIACGLELIKNGVDVLYYQSEDLLDELRHGYDEGGNYDRAMDRIKNCSLLIIDDLGTQKNTDWVASKLDSIIDYRYVNELSTIITSNLSLKVIRGLSERIASRLSSGEVVTLVGEDYRISHKEVKQ